MKHSYNFQSHPLAPEDLEMLRDTLNKWCREERIDINDPRAEEAAVELIDWFQFGLHFPDQLIEMLRRA